MKQQAIVLYCVYFSNPGQSFKLATTESDDRPKKLVGALMVEIHRQDRQQTCCQDTDKCGGLNIRCLKKKKKNTEKTL